MTIGFLVDIQSRPLVEETLQGLKECGVPSVNLFDDPPQVRRQKYLANNALALALTLPTHARE